MSERCRRLGLAAVTIALSWLAILAVEPVPPVDRLWPVAPADGAVTDPRPLFEIGYETMGEPHPRDLRFRIRLERKGRAGTTYVFDQRQRPTGWLVGEPGRVLYHPRTLLDDGEYRWEVAAWNGVAWTTAPRRHAIRIDSVPPADVEDLCVLLDDEAGGARLEWKPVTLDAHGRPEFVAAYHVYRYERSGPFRRVRPHEIAVVTQPRYIDTTPRPAGDPILYYQVTARDEAGNEGGSR
jgi:hypothetical protein